MRNFIILLLLILTFLPVFAMDNEFVMHEISSNYNEGMEIFSIDFDDDGDYDLLTAGTDCHLWLNDGNGNFSEEMMLGNTNWARSIRAADLDGDFDNDVVIADITSNSVLILENLGTSFFQFVLDNTLIKPHTVDLKDLDCDGDKDILCSEFDNSNAMSEVVWWENLGGLNFSEKNIISEIFQQSTFVFADFIDSDDHMDVVACGELLNDVMWWQNDGNQNFGDGIFIDPNFNHVHTVVGNDLDLDGDIDVLGAACVGGLLAWWENDGEGGFSRHDIDTFGGALWMDCADFDNDDDMDLFAVGQSPNCAYIYENIGDEEFVEYPLPGVFGDGFGATAEDFDNDGDMDLAAIGRSSHQICWWENKYYSIDFMAEPLTGNAPLTVEFTDGSNFVEPVTSWFWDFDNDGSFDSYVQNPTWIYEQPGVYSVQLIVLMDNEPITLTKEDYIQVFNGHSALEFDGDDSNVQCPSATSPHLTEAFTIEAWINPIGYGPDANFGLARIFDKSSISILLSKSFPVYMDSSLVVQIFHEDGSYSISTTSTNTISLNEWQHIAVCYNGIDEVKMYTNGIELMTHQPNVPNGVILDNSNEPIFIGNLQELTKGFNGIIDEVRVWNSYRSEEEIQTNMNKYLHGYESGLVSYWKMNTGNGEIIFDGTSNNNNGIITDALWVEGVNLEPTSSEENELHSSQTIYLRNYPNPFNPSTTIYFNLTAQVVENIEISIYNIKGQKIRTLKIENCKLNIGKAVWNGKDQKNNSVSSGIYFCKLKSDNFEKTSKMLLMK